MEFPRVMIINTTGYRNDTNSGNTYINLFSNYPEKKLLYLNLNDQLPNFNTSINYYSYNKKLLSNSILNRRVDSGKISNIKENSFITNIQRDSIIYYLPHSLRLLIEEIYWFTVKWDTESLENLIRKFKPEVILLPIKSKIFPNRIGFFLSTKYKVPTILFVSDDVYTFNQIYYSVIKLIIRIINRFYINRNVSNAQKLYCISDLQSLEYSKIFNKNFKVLFKGYDFKEQPKILINNIIRIVYAGNINNGRWKILEQIAKIIHNINKTSKVAELCIYSKSRVSKKVINRLNKNNSSFFFGGIDNTQMMIELKKSNILLHVESFNIKNRLETRMSFSTKIVDYFYSGKCIFAVGWFKSASIRYLQQHDAAIVAVNKTEIELKLKQLISNNDLIKEYSLKSWNCGYNYHQNKDIQNSFYNELFKVANKNRNSESSSN